MQWLIAAILASLSCSVLQASAQELRSIDVDGATIRYEVDGDGPAVVMLHGWAHSLESWHYLFPELAEDYTAIRYNRRGYASSTGVPDVSQDPIDLRMLLDELGIDEAVIIGHSQGANPALRFALEFPDRMAGLVLFGSAPPAGFGLPWNGPDRIPEGHAEVAREQGLEAWRRLFDEHPLNDGYIEGSEGARIGQGMVVAYDGRDLLRPVTPSNATSAPDVTRLGEVTVPTLVVTGELEMPYFQIAADAFAYGIPNAQRVIVDGGGHSVHLQQPERFNAEILRFLSGSYR